MPSDAPKTEAACNCRYPGSLGGDCGGSCTHPQPENVKVKLADCPTGLFVCEGELCLKTEYGNDEGRIDAYIVSSGEFFWGAAPQTIENQRAQLVMPVSDEQVAAFMRPFMQPPQTDSGSHLTNAQFVGYSARLAQKSASWAAVCSQAFFLDKPDDAMGRAPAARYLDEMRWLLYHIEKRVQP